MLTDAWRYGVYVRLAAQDVLAFHAQFWAGLGEAVLSFFLSLSLWRAVYAGATDVAGLRFDQMVTYLVAGVLVRTAVSGSVLSYLGNMYESGSVGLDLARPLSFPLICAARSVGESACYLLTRGMPVFVTAALLLHVAFPPPALLAAFALSLVLALALYFMLEFALAQLIFVLQTSNALNLLWSLLIMFGTGALIPLPFFPAWAQQVLFALPLHCIFYTPLSLFLGGELLAGPVVAALQSAGLPLPVGLLAEQGLWAAVLAAGLRIIWHFSRRRMVMLGG